MLRRANGVNGAAMKPVRHGIFACLGFALFLAGASQVRSQDVAGIARKLHWCEAHKDNFDIVFVGSSRVFHGLSPGFLTRRRARSVSAGVRSISGWIKWAWRNPWRLFESWSRPARAISGMSFLNWSREPQHSRVHKHRPVQRESPRNRLAAASGRMAMAFIRWTDRRPAVESFYQERLAAVKSNPAPRQPNELVRAELGRFYEEMAARKSRSFSSSHRRFARRMAQELMLPLEARFSLRRPGALCVALRRGEPNGCRASQCPGCRDLLRTLAQEFIAKAESTAH